MIRTGLVSVSFRKLDPKEIIQIVKEAGLDGIEWGGDIHVPHGDLAIAKEVAKLTEEAGLTIPSYGSYYRLGKGMNFADVLASAVELKAPVIRVWAGDRGSELADQEYWDQIVAESQEIADQAAKVGIQIAYEYHANTLTDTNASAKRLLDLVDRSNLTSYWQPNFRTDLENRLVGLEMILPKLTHLHVHHFTDKEKAPLIEGRDEWKRYFQLVAETGRDHYAMIEFVKDGTIEQFREDAQVLKELSW